MALTDVMTGLYASVALLAAPRARDASGLGQQIDLSLFDVQIAALANQGASYLVTGKAPARPGNDHPSIVPYQAFRAKDGHIILAIGNDTQFRSFCRASGREEIADDARFRTNDERVHNRLALGERIEAITVQRSVDEWVALMQRSNVPCGPINTLDRVFADPHARSRGARIELPHGRYGSLPLVANPIRYSGTIEYRDRPPPLGEHNAAVMVGLLRKSADHVSSLRTAGVI